MSAKLPAYLSDFLTFRMKSEHDVIKLLLITRLSGFRFKSRAAL
jgi:hypothetical protein